MARKRIKYHKPLMKFNVGTMSYEPDFPLKKNNKQNIEFDWKWITIGIIIIIIIILFAYLIIQFNP